MQNKRRFSLRFRRHKIKAPAENPIQELITLYEETESENQNQEISADGAKKKEDENSSLKILIEKSRTRHRQYLLALALGLSILLLAAAAAGFLYFQGERPFQSEKLLLEIQAPEKISVNEPFDYQISYKNQGALKLSNARLSLQYPKGLIIEKAEPTLQNHSFSIGELAAGQEGILKITGRIIDAPGDAQTLTAKLIFKPENFNSEFSKETTYSVLLEAPRLNLAFHFSANVVLGQKVNIKTKLKNEESEILKNIKILFTYPKNFQFAFAQPAAAEDNRGWLINQLAGGEENKEINIEGVFPAATSFAKDSEREQNFLVQLLASDAAGQYIIIKEEKFSIKINDQPLNTFLIINGATENRNINLGDQLTFSLVIKNNGQTVFENLKAKTVLQISGADIFNWNKIDDKHFGKIKKTETGKEIFWDETQIAELKKLNAGRDVSIDFSLPLKTYSELTNLPDLNQTIIEARSELDISTSTESVPAIKSSPVILTLSSSANLGVKALYYFDDGTPIGSGPLPFQAEQPTKLKIFWDLSNDIHEIKDISVSASLPNYVSWMEEKKAGAGDIFFDEITRKVTWKINRLPESIKEAHANFSLVVYPKNEDVGKLLELTGTATLIAKDALTDAIITRTKNILTTALEQDKFAPGDGTVKP
ncbi:hypothetical protein HZB94_01340 [Candidatus Falkowbacteria bacterium]|nr:hypothetical protein [Candidatus Falkowbacteria bacterium]